MAGKSNPAGCVWFALLASLVTAISLWLILVTFNDMPPLGAEESAGQHAESLGFKPLGCRGEYITQPDAFGGCEVEVTFGLSPSVGSDRVLSIRLRRSNALVDWKVTATTLRYLPKLETHIHN